MKPSRTLLEFTQEMKDLALALDEIPEVEQVRIWPVLKDSLQRLTGDSGLTYSVMIRKRGEEDVFTQLSVFLPDAMYNDRNNHLAVIANFKQKIAAYYQRTN